MQSSTPPRKRHWAVWAAALLLLAGATFVLSQRTTGSSTAAGSNKNGRRGAGGPIPVSVAQVKKGNIGVYVNALGTVTPVYTVTVASRVVGTLATVNYREGQMVKKGDLLAEIDPRPYTAVLLQAQGQLARDQALLKNAYVDLSRYKAAYDQHAIPEQTLATQQAQSVRTRARSSSIKAIWTPPRSTWTTPASCHLSTGASVCALSIPAISCRQTAPRA